MGRVRVLDWPTFVLYSNFRSSKFSECFQSFVKFLFCVFVLYLFSVYVPSLIHTQRLPKPPYLNAFIFLLQGNHGGRVAHDNLVGELPCVSARRASSQEVQG